MRFLRSITVAIFLLAINCSFTHAEALLLVLNKAENSLAIVDPTSLKVVATVPTGEGPHEVVASADGKTAFVANYGTGQVVGTSISIIDLATKKEIRRVDLGALRRPHGLAVAGGKLYFTCEVNRVVARYDPTLDKVDWLMGTGQDATHMLAMTPDQKKIYTANIRSNSITAMDLSAPPSSVTQIPVAPQPEGLDLRPDGKEVWVAHRGSGIVSVIDTVTKKAIETIKVGGDPYRIKITPDGKRALIANPQDSELIIVDTATRKELKRIAIAGMPGGIAVTSDSKHAAVTTIQLNGIAVIDLDTLAVIGKAETGKGPDGLTYAGK